MMFDTDLGSPFNDFKRLFFQPGDHSCAHRAGCSDFCLTAAHGTGDRGILFDQVTENTANGHGFQHLFLFRMQIMIIVIRDRSDDPGRTKCRRRRDLMSGSVLFPYRVSIGDTAAPIIFRRFIKLCCRTVIVQLLI